MPKFLDVPSWYDENGTLQSLSTVQYIHYIYLRDAAAILYMFFYLVSSDSESFTKSTYQDLIRRLLLCWAGTSTTEAMFPASGYVYTNSAYYPITNGRVVYLSDLGVTDFTCYNINGSTNSLRQNTVNFASSSVSIEDSVFPLSWAPEN